MEVICHGRFAATGMLLRAQPVSLLILQKFQVQALTDCSSYACLSQTANVQALLEEEMKHLLTLLLEIKTVSEAPLPPLSPVTSALWVLLFCRQM